MDFPDRPKRRAERFELLEGLPGEVLVAQRIAITEISREGAQIETGFPLHLDSLHDFRLTLGDRSVVVKGRVAHSRISDVDQELVVYRSGVSFVDVSEPVLDALEEFMAAIKRKEERLTEP